jgi:site-specific recombinase XerD
MRNENTFGLHFILRSSLNAKGKFAIYARIVVNNSRSELSLKKTYVRKEDWNTVKGAAKPLNDELKQLNSYLEEIRGKLVKHYRALHVNDEVITAEAVKNAYLGIAEKQRNHTLLWVVAQHNEHMQKMLRAGTLKNYYTTEKYLKVFIPHKFRTKDILLKDLNYEFISSFEHYVRSHSIQESEPCANNGAMKHMERLKKMVRWAEKNEWIDKNPFVSFQLKFHRHERDFLSEMELSAIENQLLENPMLQTVRDLFIFSCYTGLSYIDLVQLQRREIVTAVDGMKWIKSTREKSGVTINVPLLQPVRPLVDKYTEDPRAAYRDTVFPPVSNQEVNRGIKMIGEICGIKKKLTFHLARHTFATTVTLMNGVPIETISKMLGHTKLTTTMIYARVTSAKIAMDMQQLQHKLDETRSNGPLKAVR